MGRLFLKKDETAVSSLAQALLTAGAHDWHATERRSLFDTTNEQVLPALSRTDSWLFSSRTTVDDYGTERILEQSEEMVRVAGRASFSRSDPHTLGLRRFVSFLWRPLVVKLQLHEHIRRLLVVCDRGPWIEGAREPLVSLAADMNPHLTSVGFTCDLLSLNFANDSRTREFAAFLGLVDSEVWAYQRLLSTRLAGGFTPLERIEAWDEEGRPEAALLSSDEGVALGVAMERRPSLGKYIEWKHAHRDRWIPHL
jgi:hypothetical protein